MHISKYAYNIELFLLVKLIYTTNALVKLQAFHFKVTLGRNLQRRLYNS